jgi:hypothetical protein
MSSIIINIPDERDEELNSLKVKKEEFVLNALKEKINLQKSNNLQAVLTEGYKNNHKENEQLLNEFSHVDLENWYDY